MSTPKDDYAKLVPYIVGGVVAGMIVRSIPVIRSTKTRVKPSTT